jgi:hypothetical protein
LFISFQGGLGPPPGAVATVAGVAVPLGAALAPEGSELAQEARKKSMPAALSAARAADDVVRFISGVSFRGTSKNFDEEEKKRPRYSKRPRA